ncbi:uncharacterized protein LOC127711717 isoform X1 [Mytilus californianus]|uniref:uncharacterized protein LOC127711717 isoform X1 n=2 Tax=Mytilus californianus TaxID=6549 RepID=UPI00224730BF|nr:uncharacterized protein LOC127711717 isoform X1 [Mytilus californianus]
MNPFYLFENVCVKYCIQRIYVVHSVLLIVLMTGVCFGYELKCPEASQWRIRATSLCPDSSKYYCLDDAAKKRYLGNRLMKGVSENCTKVDVESPGKKIVIRGQFDAAFCDASRYQPIKYFTNVSAECLFQKSTCSGLGQTIHTNKNPVTDLTCRCDHKKGYTFTTPPKNQCFCVPSVEDCSCYRKPCNSSTIGLSQDYQCFSNISSVITQNCSFVKGSDKKDENISSTPKVPGFIDKTQPHAANFRRTPGIFVTSILCLMLAIFAVVLFLIYKDLKSLNPEEKQTILESINKGEEIYPHIRLVIIGENGVGKTCLMRRLLKQSILGVESTDGIDIDVAKCKIRIRDGKWIYKPSEYNKKIAERVKRALTVQIKQIDENNLTSASSNNVDCPNIEENQSPTDERQINESNTQLEKHDVSDKMIVPQLDDTLGSTDDDLYIMETGSEEQKPVNLQRTYAHNDEHFGSHNGETESDHKSVFEDQRLLDDLDLLESVASCKLSENEYADCGLWDFAGQKEFYATHQAFITSNSIFLLVADISQDVNTDVDTSMLQKGFDSIGEYIDFWFDSIHCYANGATEQRQSTLEPRIIVIGTGTDKINKKNLESRIQEWQRNVMVLLKDQEKGRHLETFHYISNKESPESVIDDLRQKIFNTAKKLSVWRKSTPLVWIRLETKLNILRKSNDNINIIKFEDISRIASKCSLTDYEELVKFLNEQNAIGNVIFFEDIPEYIILNPKWLVDAFRCVVSDKIKTDIDESGKISRELMLKLFQKIPELKIETFDDHILKVMEKFDIIIKPRINENLDEEISYYIPSMVISDSTIADIKTSFGLNNPNSKSSPWLILEFTFLPLAFFNHVFFDYIRKYEVCKDRNNRMAFYHGIGIFYINKTKKEQKLVVCFSRNIIALQIWDLEDNMGTVCRNIFNEIESTVHSLQQRYKLTLAYKVKVKCAGGDYNNQQGRLKLSDLINITSGKFYCEEHNEFHFSQSLSSTWFEGQIIQPTETLETSENINSNENPRYKLQKTIDTGEARLYDMVINNDGLLICSDGECDQLVTYTMTGERQLTMKLSGNPYSLAVIDNSTVAVTIPKDEKVVIIDLNKKRTKREINISAWCTGIAFIHNQLYVFAKQTLKVVNMDGPVLESIDLPEFTSDDCCSSREGNIYCTDYNKLYCIDTKANVLFSFSTKNAIHPRGVTVDDKDYVLLACSHSKNVHRITSDGSQSQEIIADLPKSAWSPFICFDINSKSIVIGMENKILIYERRE